MKNIETLFDEKKPFDNVWREMADKNGAGRCFITGRVAVRQTHVHVGCVHVKRSPVKFGARRRAVAVRTLVTVRQAPIFRARRDLAGNCSAPKRRLFRFRIAVYWPRFPVPQSRSI